MKPQLPRFAVLANPGTGDEFLRQLKIYKLTPRLIVSTHPFFDANIFHRLQFFHHRQAFEQKFFPYFFSRREKIPFLPAQAIRQESSVQTIKKLGLDYIFVFTFSILPPSIFQLPRLGAINFHPSLLPAYGGPDPLFWSLKNGETTLGISFHRITGEIDGGPIIRQYQVPVPPQEDSRVMSLRIYSLAARLFCRLIFELVLGHCPEEKPQPGTVRRQPPVTKADRMIQGSESFQQIDDLIRAAAAYGGAWIRSQDQDIPIVDCLEIPPGKNPAPLRPGLDELGNIILTTADQRIAYLVTAHA